MDDRSHASPGPPDPTDTEAVVSRPTVPPPDATPLRLLSLGAGAGRCRQETLATIVDDVAPDAVVPTGGGDGIGRLVTTATDASLLGVGGVTPDATASSDATVVAATPGPRGPKNPLTAGEIGRLVRAGDADARHVCLVTDAVSLRVDPYDRLATLAGLDEHRAGLASDLAVGATHLSTALRVGFRTTVAPDGVGGELSLVGIGRSEAELGVGAGAEPADAAVVDVYPNGGVRVETLDPAAFGLRGVPEVGARRAETLRRGGFQTPEDVATANVSDLAALDGLGRTTAATVRAGASARAEETVVPTGDGSLPSGEPVFVDVETDGLEPTVAWLIGVLDGDADDGDYYPFRARTPDDAGHLEAFVLWLTANATGRPVVAWNGLSFDFPVIERQLRERCPEHVDAWTDTDSFDALYWARDANGGNAALPGRTNGLEHVAEALGWEPRTTGIDGRAVGRLYAAYQHEWREADYPADVSEPDWDRLEAYCEDDVRALATIYDALETAARREPATDGDDRSSAPTGQGALSDFS